METESHLCDNMDDYFETIIEIVAIIENNGMLSGKQITEAGICFIRWSEACLYDEGLWDDMAEANADSIALACTSLETPPEVRWSAWTFLSTSLNDEDSASRIFAKHGIELIKRVFKEIELTPCLSAEHVGMLRIAASTFTRINTTVGNTFFKASHGYLFYRLLRIYMGVDEWSGTPMRLICRLSDFNSESIQSMLGANVDPMNYYMMIPFIRAYCGAIMCGMWYTGVAKHFKDINNEEEEEADDDDTQSTKEVELNLLNKVVRVAKDLVVSFFRNDQGQQNLFGISDTPREGEDVVRAEGREELLCVTLVNLLTFSHGHWPDELSMHSVSAVSNLLYQVLSQAKSSDKSVPLAVQVASMLAVDSRYVPYIASRLPPENLTKILDETPPRLQYQILVLLRCCVMKQNSIDRFFRHAKFLDVLLHFVEHSRDEKIIAECLFIFGMVMATGGDSFQCIKRHPLYDAVFCIENQLINIDVGYMHSFISQTFHNETMA